MSTEASSEMLINGEPAAYVPATDRGLGYGDGVFRTLRIEAGEPVAWAAQMARLAHDCGGLRLRMPDADGLYGQARRLGAERAEAVLKIMVTRGSGGRGYAPPADAQPTCIVSIHDAPPPPESLTLAESSIRLARQPALAGIKHLGRLEQVLARAECADKGWTDALMLDTAGHVTGTTMRNVVLRVDGEWVTPDPSAAGVVGATRTRIMDTLAQTGQPVRVAELTRQACYAADAMVACNSVSGAVPVKRLGTHEFHASRAMAERCRDVLAATA